jgi:ribosomal protein S18 acetylase RimI-like enzyme
MFITSATPSDVPRLVEIAIETFQPYFENFLHPLLGEELFEHQYGDWRFSYQEDIPTLLAPAEGRHTAVAEFDHNIAGFISWKVEGKPHHGEIYLLAVLPAYRQLDIGRQLCEHAIDAMKSESVNVVEIGTGGDPFHTPAQALYESLGFKKIPTANYLKQVGGESQHPHLRDET